MKADDKNDIQLKIPNDNMSEFYQWFHFRLETEAEQSHTIKLLDLAKSAYPEGWQGYDVVASYDREEWFRVPADFDGDTLTFTVIPDVAQSTLLISRLTLTTVILIYYTWHKAHIIVSWRL